MQCPSCGASSKKRSLKCPECGVYRSKSVPPAPLSTQPLTDADALFEIPLQNADSLADAPTSRSLIEFPGVRNIPQWRKELGERVREVQERKLRETAMETSKAEGQLDDVAAKAPTLELLPQAEVSPLNPLVVAALRRIERAHVPNHVGGNYSTFKGATAVAYADQPELHSEVSSFINQPTLDSFTGAEFGNQETSAPPEKLHNLAVVPNPPSRQHVEENEETSPRMSVLKPKRLIGGDPNDPALNYLDRIPTAPRVDDIEKSTAPISFRFLAAVIDLILIGSVSLLPWYVTTTSEIPWQHPRVVAFALGSTFVVAFLYLTICTAFTGRTLGMKLFCLRVVDARTKMLPTGSQSAGRAVVYILSVASTGLPLLFTFIDRDKRAVHDRFTRTEVVRM